MGKQRAKGGWITAALLLLLAAVPVAAGLSRLHELASHAAVTAANARFFAAPAPVVVHIVSALVFAMLGAFQFVPAVRANHPAWHRIAGRILMILGFATALSGIWMALAYVLPPSDNDALKIIRVVVGSLMALSIVLAYLAARRRDFMRHAAWMTRAYALGMGAGTQVLTHLPWFIVVGGLPDPVTRVWLMGAGWGINLVVAEIVNIQRAAPGTLET